MNNLAEIEKIVGHVFSDKSLIKTAFVHSSYANEHKTKSNEKLEFLGDAVLEFVITNTLYKRFNLTEGTLTKYRASLVSENSLALVTESLGLDKFLLRGKGEKNKDVTSAEKCDLFEATLGALYLDAGIEKTSKFINIIFGELIDNLEKHGLEENAKSALQEMLPKDKIAYNVTKRGQDHNPVYTCVVFINGVKCGKGEASNKRTAEELAAKNTIEMIKKA